MATREYVCKNSGAIVILVRVWWSNFGREWSWILSYLTRDWCREEVVPFKRKRIEIQKKCDTKIVAFLELSRIFFLYWCKTLAQTWFTNSNWTKLSRLFSSLQNKVISSLPTKNISEKHEGISEFNLKFFLIGQHVAGFCKLRRVAVGSIRGIRLVWLYWQPIEIWFLFMSMIFVWTLF